MIAKADILGRLKLASNSTSDADLARFLGIAPATLSNWKSRGSLDYDLVFSKCEQLNLDWLLTGRGNMEKEPDLQQAGIQVQEKFPLKTDNLVDLQRIPLYNLEATAGLVSLFNDVDAIPISYISLPDLPACDGAVYVRGALLASRTVDSKPPPARSKICCSSRSFSNTVSASANDVICEIWET